ncbi:MAG TPA: hypothetical protein VEE82_04040 [Thermodesulfovibrionales bacterium]|nr:hypothetical protein [Thermodesulfovibrionales bacterium]
MKKTVVLLLMVSALVLFAAVDGIPADSPSTSPISGKVIETMDSGGYTYALLEKDGNKIWVAVPQMKVEKGKNMSFQPGGVMENFTSKTLNRTFDKIIFSAGPVK